MGNTVGVVHTNALREYGLLELYKNNRVISGMTFVKNAKGKSLTDMSVSDGSDGSSSSSDNTSKRGRMSMAVVKGLRL